MASESDNQAPPAAAAPSAPPATLTTADESPLIELSFAPQWARQPPPDNYYADAPGPQAETRGDRGRGRDRGLRPRRDQGPPRPRPDRGRPPAGGGRPPRPPRAGERRDDRARPDRHAPHDRHAPRDRHAARERTGGEGDRRAPPSQPRPPAVAVRFLPSQRMLRAVARRMAESRRAFALMSVAWEFLSRPAACEVHVMLDPKARKATLYQCNVCGAGALDREQIGSHVLHDHLDHYFDKQEIQREPPTGNFICVARCGLTGTLLGPPNHHSYQLRLKEFRAERFPYMSPQEYESRIVTVRDAEAIEQWKREACTATVYRLKGQAEAEAMTRQAAIDHVARTFLADAILESKTLSMPAIVARRLNDRVLLNAVREAWEDERRFPATLLGALRGALNHMGFTIFRANGRTQYVSRIAPAPLATADVVPEIAEMIAFMVQHPGCTRRAMRDALRPQITDDQVQEVLGFFGPLLWLIERGHVIEFFDGSLAAPRPPAPAAPSTPAH